MIPTFPEFYPLTLDCRPEVHAYLAQHPPLASEYTFTNLYAWAEVQSYALTRFENGFLIRKGDDAHMSFLQPLVPEQRAEAVQACFDYLAAHGAVPVIARVGEDFLTPDLPATVAADRDNDDYLYAVEELIDLPGDKFHDKKNLLNQFRKKYEYRYLPLTPEIIDRGLSFQHTWCAERECEKDEGLAHEHCATFRMLRHFRELELLGGAFEVDGQLVSLTLAEPLNPETMVIHVEKGKAGMTGIYQAINQEFLSHAAREYRYVNREQDLGIPGLRKAKMSYNPVRLVEKFILTPR